MISLENFKATLLTADPNATKFWSDDPGNYTVWTPVKIRKNSSDNLADDVYYDVQVERYTKKDPDPIVAAIYDTLESAGIPFEYVIDADKESGYIRHIYSCLVR